MTESSTLPKGNLSLVDFQNAHALSASQIPSSLGLDFDGHDYLNRGINFTIANSGAKRHFDAAFHDESYDLNERWHKSARMNFNPLLTTRGENANQINEQVLTMYENGLKQSKNTHATYKPLKQAMARSDATRSNLEECQKQMGLYQPNSDAMKTSSQSRDELRKLVAKTMVPDTTQNLINRESDDPTS
eukprot:CAMPEP_0172515182 /NCGR_PEP_ID=MMETSP1066-20121228/265976_1 /TAXON_ID=671091 /ORGANISM="Coscinodiscus wailesii, Strain CCMP2513" /LENGTH=188 /DNA_ID=CAMNT_0013296155 /DNA_START=114 /DNA_END=677 /DNA_ORIENTATION=+